MMEKKCFLQKSDSGLKDWGLENNTNLNSIFCSTLLDVGGSGQTPPWRYQPPLGDAPTNSKFVDFSQFDPYFHLVKSFFIFYKKITVKFFCHPKKERFFHENGQKHIFLTNIGIFCFKYVISMLSEIF